MTSIFFLSSYPVLTLPLLKEKCLKNYEALAGPLRKEFTEPEIEQIYKVIKELPTINVEIMLRGPLKKEHEVERMIKQPVDYKQWNQVHAGEEYTLMVSLRRFGARTSDNIYCRFPKPKDEGWFLTLGSQENGELLALKRVGYRSNRSSHPLIFTSPTILGRAIYTIYLVSDGIIGMDQQFNIQLEVIEGKNEKVMINDEDDRYYE
jgi:activating signal cointegrator complex subunit 3